jgi:hypothetical protein
LMRDLNPLLFAAWAAPFTYRKGLAAILFRSDGFGFAVSPESTIENGDSSEGYIYVTNTTNPGTYLESGFFSLYTYAPANATTPWTRVFASTTLAMLPYAAEIMSPNRTHTLQWTKLTVRNTSRTPSSVLSFGGPLPSPLLTGDQYLAVNDRGEYLADYFSTVNVSATGAVLLVERDSGVFVGGNINDATARIVDGSQQLVPLNELQDPRVAAIVQAARVDGGSESVLLTCATPCVFTFWPWSGALIRADRWSRLREPILFRSFSAVRVVSVTDDVGLDLRVIVVIPSGDVVGALYTGVLISLVAPLSAVLVLCTALFVGVNFLFRDLVHVERSLQVVASRYAHAGSGAVTRTQLLNRRGEIDHLAGSRTPFVEMQRVHAAMVRFVRELQMLRAFSPTDMPSELPHPPSTGSFGDSTRELNDLDHTAFREMPSSIIGAMPVAPPYVRSTLWQVPVSTLSIHIAQFQLGACGDPVALHHMHREILECVQRHAGRFSGASLDSFFGDRFLLHFNAAGRTHGHALAALDVGLCVLRDIAPIAVAAAAPGATLHFGVASAPALCGYLGPSRLKVFTVVSDSVAQAAVLSRIASKDQTSGFATWRAAEIATQQMLHMSKFAECFVLIQRLVLRPAQFLVVLPGDSATVVFRADVVGLPSYASR